MAVKFTGGKAPVGKKTVSAKATTKASSTDEDAGAATSPSTTGPTTKSKSSGTPAWAKRGKAAVAEMEKYEKDAEKHFEAKNRMWRFWLPKGESGPITFVDGNLMQDGTLDILTYREHTVKVNGEWENFVCIAEAEPCPICEGGDFPSLVGVLTIIDHRTYKGKKGVYKDTPRLFVAKKNTLKQLQLMATKREGLAGCRFDASRLNDNDPTVGGSFDFESKTPVKDLVKMYTRKGKDGKTTTVFAPANYEKEIVYEDAKKLRALGFGAGKPIGTEKSEAVGEDAADHM